MNNLYNNLLSLTQKNEAFYFVDQFVEDIKYRIFLYRLASYTDFCEPDALESRGITFELDQNDNPVRLACRPFKKFFNLGENPFTMGLNFSADNIEYIADKLDGSLISSYIHYAKDGTKKLMLKTKGSLHSEQAIAAMKLLASDAYSDFRDKLFKMTDDGFTVNMEYTSPENRIVLGYEEPSLSVLAVRHNETGNFLHLNLVKTLFPTMKDFTEEAVLQGVDKYLSDVKGRTGIEGVVVCLRDGTLVKVKADAYVALHHAKDSINSPRRLFEAVVMESADDLRSMFRDDPLALRQIDEMQQKVSSLYNKIVNEVEIFYSKNKALIRKDYAVLGQQVLDKRYFSLAMMKYLGKEVDYKGFLIKNYKDFGIKDDPVNLEEMEMEMEVV